MLGSWEVRWINLAAATCGLFLFGACGESGTQPETVASVEVTSPIGRLLDVGRSTQLLAAAKNSAGEPVSVSLVWSSSEPAVVSVSSAGRIDALNVGVATIRAEASAAAGTLDVQVVDADVARITMLVTDPFFAALVGGTSSEVKTQLQDAVSDCVTGASQGALDAVQDCTASIREQITDVTDPTDRALLAAIELFIDEIDRLLGI